METNNNIKNNQTNDNQQKEDDSMNTNTAVKIDNNFFNEFLKLNKNKINTITPKNPIIKKGDEWTRENCWDTSRVI